MYSIVVEKQAAKDLAKISSPYYESIVKSLKSLALNPRPIGYKKLKGRDGYRIRVADYRIIYKVEDKIVTVFILEIGHRKNVYTK